MNYTAELQHSEETFRRLAKTQHNEYGKPIKLAMSIMGIASLLIGLRAGFSSISSIVLLFVGCWIFTSLNIPAQRNAEKLIELANGDFPHTHYQFLSDKIRITSGETVTDLDYKKVYDLLEDSEYLYLFLSRASGYMVPKRSVRPAEFSAFAAFLEEKTGLKRHISTGLLSFNLFATLKRRKERKQRSLQKHD